MKTISRPIKIAAVIIVSLLVIAAVGFFSIVRPLLPSDDYSLTAMVDGSPVEANLFKAFPSGSYYVHLVDTPNERHNWFGVAFGRKSVFVPVGLYTSPWGSPYIHSDQDKGVVVTDGKMEDNWKVAFTDSGVTFNNDSNRIQLSN